MIRITLLSFFVFGTLQAQPPPKKPLENPDIVWVGAYYSNYPFDVFDYTKTEDSTYLKSIGIEGNKRVKIASIKQQISRKGRTRHAWDNEEFPLIYELKDSAQLSKMTLYKDGDCSQKMSFEEAYKEVYRMDTLLIGNPETFDEKPQYSIQLLDPNDVKYYRVRHLVYYDKKQNRFGNWVQSFAPVRAMYDDMGNFLYYKPMFWMPVEQVETEQNLDNPDVLWAQRTARSFDWWGAENLKKNMTAAQCVEQLMAELKKNAGKEAVYDLFFEPMSAETVKQVIDGSPQKEIIRFRIYEEWYWNSKTLKMQHYSVFWTPVRIFRDADNNRLIQDPLFWLPCQKR